MTQAEAPGRGRSLVLAACLMATFMAAVEGTIIATAMPTIVADLGGFALFAWAFAAYLLQADGPSAGGRAALGVATAVLLAILLRHERRAAEPMLPLVAAGIHNAYWLAAAFALTSLLLAVLLPRGLSLTRPAD